MQLMLTLIMSLAVLSACRRSTTPVDFFDPSEFTKTYEDRVRSELNAPIVVVGQVEKSSSTGVPRPTERDPRIKVELTEVLIHVEQIIKGSISGSRLTFYYYAYSPKNDRDLGIARYSPSPGQRCIYFLTTSAAGYRLIGDVADYTIRVRSGFHPQDFCKEESTGCCIAEILLTPGPGYDETHFANQLVGETSGAGVFCSRRRALQLVKELLRNSDPKIVRAAGEVLDAATSRGEL